MRKLQKTFLDFGEKKTGQRRIVNYIYTRTKSIINLVGSIFVFNLPSPPKKEWKKSKLLFKYKTKGTHPSHILQAQGDRIVSVLLLTVVITGGVQNPFVIQVLHQST